MSYLKKNTYWIISLLTLASISLFFDLSFLQWLAEMRTPFMNEIMIWISNWVIPIGFATVCIISFAKKNYTQLINLVFAFVATFEITHLLKLLFAIPRPAIDSITIEPSYAFPSMHSAFIAMLIPFAKTPIQRIIAIIFAISVIFSRMYLGVHTPSQVFAGALVGLITASYLIFIEKQQKWLKKFWHYLQKHLELRRQLMHLIVVLILALGIWLKIFSPLFLTIILISGIAISLISRKKAIPGIEWALNTFERSKNRQKLPGSGVIYLFASALVIQHFFEPKIVFFALIITAVGDAVSPIVGSYFGKIPLPWNKTKHAEGLLSSIAASAFVLAHMMPFVPALLSSAITMTIESISLKLLGSEIDDNIVVPLVAAISLSYFF